MGDWTRPIRRRTVTIQLYRLERTARRTHLWRLGPPWHWLGSCEQPRAGAEWEHRFRLCSSRDEAESALVAAHGAPLELLTAPDVPRRERSREPSPQLSLPGTPRATSEPHAR